ncbi:glycosyltransferase [Oenococcus sp.]|uniref:glycosyltransferase n=1 Tax=Oenococcus sp. TaxID=1979414 RepID=UPI0039EB96ED
MTQKTELVTPAPTKRISILFVGMSGNRGGTETFIFNMAGFLRKNFEKYFDVYVLDDTQEGISVPDNLKKMNVKIMKVFVPLGRINHFKKVKILKEFFHQNPFDIVHINANSPSFAVYVSELKGTNTKIVFHSHNTSLSFENLTQKILYYGQIHRFRKVLDHTNLTRVAASDVAGKWMFHQQKFTTLPNGVNPSNYVVDQAKRLSMRESFDIPKNASVFLFVGRLEYQKYPSFGILAFKSLLENHPELLGKVFLIMVGDGSQSADLQTLSKPYHTYIKFLGLRKDVADLMNMADFLLLPSRFEAMPFVVLEAQASGLKIIQSSESENKGGIVTSGHFFPSLQQGPGHWGNVMNQMIENKVPFAARADDNRIFKGTVFNIDKGFDTFVRKIYLSKERSQYNEKNGPSN